MKMKTSIPTIPSSNAPLSSQGDDITSSGKLRVDVGIETIPMNVKRLDFVLSILDEALRIVQEDEDAGLGLCLAGVIGAS
jgi:hypothetical protein